MKKTSAFPIFGLLLFLFSACVALPMPATPAKTLIPTRINSAPSSSSALVYVVTTRAGQELRFDFIRLEPNEYVAFHTESIPQGIPITSGVEIAYDYLWQVEFGQLSPDWQNGGGVWPVSLTLTDGTQMNTSLGFKAHHQIHLVGPSDYGDLDLDLVDIQKIILQRTGADLPVPGEPRGTRIFTVHTTAGDSVQVADPKIFGRCMYEVYCCHDETLSGLPIAGQAAIPLNEIAAVVFTTPETVKITIQSGQVVVATLREPVDCPGTPWLLRGKAALGDFEIELKDVTEITLP